jgi:hypothetical protein
VLVLAKTVIRLGPTSSAARVRDGGLRSLLALHAVRLPPGRAPPALAFS